MPTRIAYLFLATALLAGCRTGRNYPDTTGPRYAGRPSGGASALAFWYVAYPAVLTTFSQDKQQ